MEESMIPSLSTGVVGSRFVTQDEVETAKARRDEQWKAAYARLVFVFVALLLLRNILSTDLVKNHLLNNKKTHTMADLLQK
jgi:hypothetical protein